MAEYSDLPNELQRAILLHLPIDDVLSLCRADSANHKSCVDQFFWLNYITGLSTLSINRLLISMIKKSQTYVYPLLSAIQQLKTIIFLDTYAYTIFMAVMKGDNRTVDLLDDSFDKISYIKAVNSIIDKIRHSRDPPNKYFDIITNTNPFTVDIIGEILKRTGIYKLTSIKIPKSVNNKLVFIDTVMEWLAREEETELLSQILRNVSDRTLKKRSYSFIANYLPVELYSALDIKSKMCNRPYDLEHLKLVLIRSNSQDTVDYFSSDEHFEPREYVDAIINSPQPESVKDYIIRNSGRRIANGEEFESEWPSEVDKLWSQYRQRGKFE